MVSSMTDLNADFVKLFGFFLYHQTHDVFGYWDWKEIFQYIGDLIPMSPFHQRGDAAVS